MTTYTDIGTLLTDLSAKVDALFEATAPASKRRFEKKLREADDRCYDRYTYGIAVDHISRGAGTVIPRPHASPINSPHSGRRWVYWMDTDGYVQASYPEALTIAGGSR